uniref:Uncharacterized protein n=1 Tax=Rhizophagus irregularis (strain DAOM 181602 / DAOM 197198 / MUCL 43194) TaxID=747089 RepID=U9T6L3_RHIID
MWRSNSILFMKHFNNYIFNVIPRQTRIIVDSEKVLIHPIIALPLSALMLLKRP